MRRDENYPLMQDVVDARPGEMDDIKSFLPAWSKVLVKKGTKGRPAVLLLETVNRLEGINGVSKLAKKWANSQPQGYLFWLNILKQENDPKGIINVGTEGLKVLKQGRFSAFRREVKAVVKDSDLLRNSGFLK